MLEAFSLLCSIFSIFLSSLALSLLLPFRLLRRRVEEADGAESVSFYEDTVWHERRCPVHHSFRYSVRYALIDLDRAHCPPPNHLPADVARSLAGTSGPVCLLTIPPSVGYEQNPLSVYYCYEMEECTPSLKKCIAEVTNTPWGERVSFLFDPKADLVAKALHVSPFMDMLGTWRIRTNSPGSNLFIAISVQHPELGDYFTATLTAKKVASSSTDPTLFFWLMPHKVAVWIYWHALKLWWKNVKYIEHPRYLNSSYREDALLLDRRLQSCPAAGDVQNLLSKESDFNPPTEKNQNDRSFRWTDAKWPWA